MKGSIGAHKCCLARIFFSADGLAEKFDVLLASVSNVEPARRHMKPRHTKCVWMRTNGERSCGKSNKSRPIKKTECESAKEAFASSMTQARCRNSFSTIQKSHVISVLSEYMCDLRQQGGDLAAVFATSVLD